MLKRLRVIAILLCGVIFLNGLCIGSASAVYTPKPLMVSDEQSIVDQIDHARHDKNNFKGIINEIDQYYKGKDSEGKSREYSKEFNEYCLSVLFKLYNEILKTDSLQKEFLSLQSKGSKEGIPNIKEVILTGVGVLGGLNDTTNFLYSTLLYRVLSLELDKNRNESIIQRLDSGDKDISRHIESILKNGKNLLGSGIFEQANFETLPMVTQLNLLRCVKICEKNVGLLLSDEELHKILKQIARFSLEEYQNDLKGKEIINPTTSSSSSSSNENNIKRTKNLEVKILIQFAKIRDVDLKKQISALRAVIDYFGGVEKAAKYEQGREALIQLGRIPQYSNNKRIIALKEVIDYFGGVKDAARDAQGREALIQLGRIPQYSDNERIIALEAVIDYFYDNDFSNKLSSSSSSGSSSLPSSTSFASPPKPSNDKRYKIAAKYEQGREALIALGKTSQASDNDYERNKKVSALNAVIDYFFNKDSSNKLSSSLSSSSSSSSSSTSSASSSKPSNDKRYKIAAKDEQGREALIALGKTSQASDNDYERNKKVSALNAVISYFGNIQDAAEYAQGREALIQLGKIPHGGKEGVGALNAVIDYFFNKDSSNELSSSEEKDKYEIAANYEQGREALIALGKIPHGGGKEQVSALNAVINYFGNIEVAANYEQGREALIQLGKIPHGGGKEQVSALNAVIEYFFRLATPSSSSSSSSSSTSSSTSFAPSSKPSNDRRYKIAANYAQGREALIALGKTSQASDNDYERNKKVSALNAVISHFGNIQDAAEYAQGREALIQLGKIPHGDGKEQVSALNAVIDYFFRLATPLSSSSSSSSPTLVDEKGKYEIAAREVQGREALIALGKIPHGGGKEQVSALNAVINYFGNIEVAANYEQGREALIALGRIPYGGGKEQVSALNAVIEYFFRFATPLSSSSSSSSSTLVDERGKYEIAAEYEQGREALIQLGKIPHGGGKEQVSALNAVIEYFFRLATPLSSSSSSSSSTLVDERGKYEIAAEYEQGREALIQLGRVRQYSDNERIGALEAVIDYFFNKASSHKLSSSSSSSSYLSSSTSSPSKPKVGEKEKNKYEIAAEYEQGREALIQWCRIPKNDSSKRVAILKILKEKNYKFNEILKIADNVNVAVKKSGAYLEEPLKTFLKDMAAMWQSTQAKNNNVLNHHRTYSSNNSKQGESSDYFNHGSSKSKRSEGMGRNEGGPESLREKNLKSYSSKSSNNSAPPKDLSLSPSSSTRNNFSRVDNSSGLLPTPKTDSRMSLNSNSCFNSHSASNSSSSSSFSPSSSTRNNFSRVDDSSGLLPTPKTDSRMSLNSSMPRMDSRHNNRPIFPHADKPTLLFGNKGPVKDSNMDRFYYNDNRVSSPSSSDSSSTHSHHRHHHRHHRHDRQLGDGRRRSHSPSYSSLDLSSTHKHHKHHKHHHRHHHSNSLLPRDRSRSHTPKRSRSKSKSSDSSSYNSSSSSSGIRQGIDEGLHKKPKLE